MRQLIILAALSLTAALGWGPSADLAAAWTGATVDPGLALASAAALTGWAILLRTWLGTALLLVAALPALRRLAPIGRVLVPQVLRPVVLGAVGVGLLASASSMAPAAQAAPSWPTSPPTQSEEPPAEPGWPESAPSPPDPTPSPTRSPSAPAPEPPTEAPREDPSSSAESRPPGAPEPAPDREPSSPDNPEAAADDESAEDEPERYRVAQGDNLWTIVESRLGPDATTAEVASAVKALFHANREAIGANPNLIPTGITIEVRLS